MINSTKPAPPVPQPFVVDDFATLAGAAGAIKAAIEAAAAAIALFVSANEARKVVNGWKAEGHQEKRYWNFKPRHVAAGAALDITISNVDDDANIWWNGAYLYTHSRGDGPRKITVTPRAGENLFHFELNNHGAHAVSLHALVEQNGKRLGRLKLAGDDQNNAPMHIAFAPMKGV